MIYETKRAIVHMAMTTPDGQVLGTEKLVAYDLQFNPDDEHKNLFMRCEIPDFWLHALERDKQWREREREQKQLERLKPPAKILRTLENEPWLSMLAAADAFEEQGHDDHAGAWRWIAENHVRPQEQQMYRHSPDACWVFGWAEAPSKNDIGACHYLPPCLWEQAHIGDRVFASDTEAWIAVVNGILLLGGVPMLNKQIDAWKSERKALETQK